MDMDRSEYFAALALRFAPIGARVLSSEIPLPWTTRFVLRITLVFMAWCNFHLGVDVIRTA
jgi:hypothetical protein